MAFMLPTITHLIVGSVLEPLVFEWDVKIQVRAAPPPVPAPACQDLEMVAGGELGPSEICAATRLHLVLS